MSEFFYGGVVFNNFGPRTNMTSLDYKMRINPKVGWSDTNYLFFPVTVPGPSTGFAGTGGKKTDTFFIIIIYACFGGF